MIEFYILPIRSPPPLDIELTPLNASALASLITSPALRKGNPNDSFRPVFGDEDVTRDLGVTDTAVTGESDKLGAGLEEVAEISIASTPLLLFDDGTVPELTDNLDMVGNIIAKEGGSCFLVGDADTPNWSGVVILPDVREVPSESITSSELTSSVLIVFENPATGTVALFGYKQDLETFGLDLGDTFGETPRDVHGEFRGDCLGDSPVERQRDGRGNSSLSSSSAIGDAFRRGIKYDWRCGWDKSRGGESERSDAVE